MRRGYILASICGLAFGAVVALTSCKSPTPQTQTQAPAPASFINNTNQLAPATATPPVPTEAVNTQSGGLNDDVGNQPPVYAEQPPPPLPDYSQPPSPGDNYYWTPGYWDYSNTGYYWVPGEWLTAPWVGALWTPPYWEADNGRYRFHRGYWASRVGFYGGIDYGTGYPGTGYYGGHWDNGKFFYNRAATNVGAAAHNTYSGVVPRKMPDNAGPRVSFNGGRGGINAHPSAADAELLHERRSPPQVAQLQHAHETATEHPREAPAERNTLPQNRPAPPVAPQPHVQEPRQAPVERNNLPLNRPAAPVMPHVQPPPERKPEPFRPQPLPERREPVPAQHPAAMPSPHPAPPPPQQPHAEPVRPPANARPGPGPRREEPVH